MEQLVTSDFKLGIIAGGQLGKMLVLAVSNRDVKHRYWILTSIALLQHAAPVS